MRWAASGDVSSARPGGAAARHAIARAARQDCVRYARLAWTSTYGAMVCCHLQREAVRRSSIRGGQFYDCRHAMPRPHHCASNAGMYTLTRCWPILAPCANASNLNPRDTTPNAAVPAFWLTSTTSTQTMAPPKSSTADLKPSWESTMGFD